MQKKSSPPTTRKSDLSAGNLEARPNSKPLEKTQSSEAGRRGRTIDRTGHTYGKLTVIANVDFGITSGGRRYTRSLCRCECGRELIVANKELSAGQKSCGCWTAELTRQRSTTHGQGAKGRITSTYRCWHNMIQRCTNPNTSHYHCYGGRGITVCESWRKFENFFSDMGEKPNGMTIERVNNELGYNKDNCVYATPAQQANNKRTNRNITFNGETHNVCEWAKILGVKRKVITDRLDRLGWSLERTLTQSVQVQAAHKRM